MVWSNWKSDQEGQMVHTIIDNEIVSGWNEGIFNSSRVVEPSPMIGGHPGGTISYPVMVIESIDRFYVVPVSSVVKDIKILINKLERRKKRK